MKIIVVLLYLLAVRVRDGSIFSVNGYNENEMPTKAPNRVKKNRMNVTAEKR